MLLQVYRNRKVRENLEDWGHLMPSFLSLVEDIKKDLKQYKQTVSSLLVNFSKELGQKANKKEPL